MTQSSPDIIEKLSTPLTVGGIKIRNRTFLAPMSGVTDLPFRKLAWRFGAGLVVSEMVASQALMEGEGEMQLKLMGNVLPQHVVQLAGREAKWMGLAAKMAQDNGAQIVDINMGCPAKRVTTGYSGSALMRDLDHALTLIDAVVTAVDIPVTLKMRLGWDHQSINAPQLAERAQNAGVTMITVHGRTRCQFYKGHADWDQVRGVREATSLPLVVNGDIRDIRSADAAMRKSGADAIMVGRGSYGAPWLPGQLACGVSMNRGEADCALDAVISHYEDMLDFYGVEAGIRQARKHLGWYLDCRKSSTEAHILRKKILTSFDPAEVISLLQVALEDMCFTSSSTVALRKAA